MEGHGGKVISSPDPQDPLPASPKARRLPLVAVLLVSLGITSSIHAQMESGTDPAVQELSLLVESFLRENDEAIGARLSREIETAAKGDATIVEQALREARPGKSDLAAQGRLVIPRLPAWPADAQPQVQYWLPAGYPADRKHPLLLILSADETEARMILPKLEADVGDAVVVTVKPSIGASLRDGEGWAELARTVQRETARMFAVDGERVYLIADPSGAHGAWMLLLAAADVFAGAVIHGGYPDLPYPAHTYPLFMENLRHTPIVVREELPTVDPETTPTGGRGAAPLAGAPLRALEIWAGRERMPLRVVRNQLDAAPTDAWRAAVAGLFEQARPQLVSNVSHWFGGPAAGSARWLRAARLDGEPWNAEQVSILPGAGGDRDTVMTGFFEERLAYFSGKLENNRLTIVTRHCTRIEIRLTREMIDWSRPVTVVVNGIQRHDGVVSPSIPTLLRQAREGHLSRPIRAVISLDVHADSPRRPELSPPPRP